MLEVVELVVGHTTGSGGPRRRAAPSTKRRKSINQNSKKTQASTSSYVH